MALQSVVGVSLALISVITVAASGAGRLEKPWAGDILSERTAGDVPSGPRLDVLRQSYIARPGLRKSVMQTPLRIHERKYDRGIGTYATSEIVVTLPKPGRTFQAEVGIDSNHETNGLAGPRGNGIFVVEVGGKEAFRSGVMHVTDAPVPVKIDLRGAKEFTLKVLDTGDGPEYDEGDWADASVTLEDGGMMWLDDFPVFLAPASFGGGIPFSFVYDGKPSSELLPGWERGDKTSDLPNGRRLRTITFTDPSTGLQVKCESTVFDGFPAADWVVYFTNTGSSDTPIIEKIRAADMRLAAPPGDVVLHHPHGSTATATDFLPIDDPLAPNAEISLSPVEGRSSDTTLPFFNLEWSGGGVICAVGWTGQWSAQIRRDAGSGLTIDAGQQTTHLRLHPGETIRTPRMLMLAWRGDDPIRGHNQFRQLLVKHYLPRIDGQVVMPPVTQNTWFTYSGNGVTEANQLDMIRVAADAGVECYWLDAGWFADGGWSQGAGSWSARTDAFPNGLKPLADAAHNKGMKFVLWFEPERVCPGTQIAREHPEWAMHVRPGEEQGAIQNHADNMLFRLGDPAARKWLTDLLSKCIDDWHVDVYRQDFNIFGTTKFWEAADTPDRQGMAENLHIQGLYAMWDELRARHPGLWIDNCASGGRRIDLETISRSLPLWRSDSQVCGKPMPIQDEVQTAGLSLYVPLHSASVWTFDPYEWRSVATSGTNLCMDHRAPVFDLEGARRAVKEVKSLRPFWLGDYYPLVDIGLDESQWCAWQFDRPDLGAGFAMYFRRPKCRYIAMASGLRGLDPDAMYEVTFPDTGKRKTMKGSELAAMPVMIEKAPSSVLITYKRKS